MAWFWAGRKLILVGSVLLLWIVVRGFLRVRGLLVLEVFVPDLRKIFCDVGPVEKLSETPALVCGF